MGEIKLTHQQIRRSGLLLASTVGALSLIAPADAEPLTVPHSKQNNSQTLLQQQGRLENGDTVLPSDGSVYDQYTFEGQAGQEVTVSLSSSEFDTYVAVMGPDGDIIGENDDANSNSTNSEITVTLPTTGTYTVMANAYDSSGRGRYTVTVTARDRVANQPRPTPAPETQCPEYSNEGFYARITTQGDDVRVRATPNGRVIGAIPNGWEVIVQERDSTGNWTRVTSHFGEYDIEGFGSAENFRNGWVSTSYLRDIGYSCDKPMNLQGLLQPQLFGQRQVVVGEDWITRGDRIAQVARTKPAQLQ